MTSVFRNRWLLVVALGGCLCLGLLGLSKHDQACKAPGPEHRVAIASNGSQAGSSPANFFERIARALESIPTATDSSDKTEREIADLAAQQDMACWAFWMVLATIGQGFVGTVGLIALIATLDQGREALGIGQDSVEATRDSNAITVAKDRAFVFVDDIVIEPAKNGSYQAQVIWKNAGTTPTKAFRAHVNINLWIFPLPPQFDWQDYGSVQERALVAPQGRLPSGVLPIETSWAVIAHKNTLTAHPKSASILIWGWCEYNDVFPGTNRHRTEFCREIYFIEDPNLVDTNMWFSGNYRTFPTTKYNNTDDECLKQLKTSPPHDGS